MFQPSLKSPRAAGGLCTDFNARSPGMWFKTLSFFSRAALEGPAVLICVERAGNDQALRITRWYSLESGVSPAHVG